MKFKKLGRIFETNKQFEWMNSHAAVPTAQHIKGDIYKIYFATRNKDNRSLIGWITVDITDPFKIISISEEPILELGGLGNFDEYGTTISDVINYKDKIYMFYTGWNIGTSVAFRNSIGLAESTDGGKTFKKKFKGPIMDRSIYDECFVATPTILFEDGIYKMWYLSCIKWEQQKEKPKHFYHIKYAQSKDCINWTREGIVAIDFAYKNEYAISVPRVIKENKVYKMWYAYRGGPRGETYRIGYAESKNGKNWERQDEKIELDISKSGWDSEMICYPYILDHKWKRYMLYNGNSYGKTGFGLAEILD